MKKQTKKSVKKRAVKKKAVKKSASTAVNKDVKAKSTEQSTNRTSREQETWDNIDIHASMDAIGDNDGPLPEITPRQGYVQRWIRTKLNGEDDPANISRATNQHWRRRDPDTIPVGISVPTIHTDGIGNTIGISGMILMERPVEINDIYKSRVRDKTKAQMRSVDESLHKIQSEGDGATALSKKGSNSKVSLGQMPVDD